MMLGLRLRKNPTFTLGEFILGLEAEFSFGFMIFYRNIRRAVLLKHAGIEKRFVDGYGGSLISERRRDGFLSINKHVPVRQPIPIRPLDEELSDVELRFLQAINDGFLADKRPYVQCFASDFSR